MSRYVFFARFDLASPKVLLAIDFLTRRSRRRKIPRLVEKKKPREESLPSEKKKTFVSSVAGGRHSDCEIRDITIARARARIYGRKSVRPSDRWALEKVRRVESELSFMVAPMSLH